MSKRQKSGKYFTYKVSKLDPVLMLVDWPSTYILFVLILLSQFLPKQASGCSPVAHLHVHGLATFPSKQIVLEWRILLSSLYIVLLKKSTDEIIFCRLSLVT